MDSRLDWVKSLSHKKTEDMLLKIGHVLGLELCHDRHAYRSDCNNLLWYYRPIPSVWQKKLDWWKNLIDLNLDRAIAISHSLNKILERVLDKKQPWIFKCYSPTNIQCFAIVDTFPFRGISHREEL